MIYKARKASTKTKVKKDVNSLHLNNKKSECELFCANQCKILRAKYTFLTSPQIKQRALEMWKNTSQYKDENRPPKKTEAKARHSKGHQNSTPTTRHRKALVPLDINLTPVPKLGILKRNTDKDIQGKNVSFTTYPDVRYCTTSESSRSTQPSKIRSTKKYGSSAKHTDKPNNLKTYSRKTVTTMHVKLFEEPEEENPFDTMMNSKCSWSYRSWSTVIDQKEHVDSKESNFEENVKEDKSMKMESMCKMFNTAGKDSVPDNENSDSFEIFNIKKGKTKIKSAKYSKSTNNTDGMCKRNKNAALGSLSSFRETSTKLRSNDNQDTKKGFKRKSNTDENEDLFICKKIKNSRNIDNMIPIVSDDENISINTTSQENESNSFLEKCAVNDPLQDKRSFNHKTNINNNIDTFQKISKKKYAPMPIKISLNGFLKSVNEDKIQNSTSGEGKRADSITEKNDINDLSHEKISGDGNNNNNTIETLRVTRSLSEISSNRSLKSTDKEHFQEIIYPEKIKDSCTIGKNGANKLIQDKGCVYHKGNNNNSMGTVRVSRSKRKNRKMDTPKKMLISSNVITMSDEELSITPTMDKSILAETVLDKASNAKLSQKKYKKGKRHINNKNKISKKYKDISSDSSCSEDEVVFQTRLSVQNPKATEDWMEISSLENAPNFLDIQCDSLENECGDKESLKQPELQLSCEKYPQILAKDYAATDESKKCFDTLQVRQVCERMSNYDSPLDTIEEICETQAINTELGMDDTYKSTAKVACRKQDISLQDEEIIDEFPQDLLFKESNEIPISPNLEREETIKLTMPNKMIEFNCQGISISNKVKNRKQNAVMKKVTISEEKITKSAEDTSNAMNSIFNFDRQIENFHQNIYEEKNHILNNMFKNTNSNQTKKVVKKTKRYPVDQTAFDVLPLSLDSEDVKKAKLRTESVRLENIKHPESQYLHNKKTQQAKEKLTYPKSKGKPCKSWEELEAELLSDYRIDSHLEGDSTSKDAMPKEMDAWELDNDNYDKKYVSRKFSSPNGKKASHILLDENELPKTKINQLTLCVKADADMALRKSTSQSVLERALEAMKTCFPVTSHETEEIQLAEDTLVADGKRFCTTYSSNGNQISKYEQTSQFHYYKRANEIQSITETSSIFHTKTPYVAPEVKVDMLKCKKKKMKIINANENKDINSNKLTSLKPFHGGNETEITLTDNIIRNSNRKKFNLKKELDTDLDNNIVAVAEPSKRRPRQKSAPKISFKNNFENDDLDSFKSGLCDDNSSKENFLNTYYDEYDFKSVLSDNNIGKHSLRKRNKNALKRKGTGFDNNVAAQAKSAKIIQRSLSKRSCKTEIENDDLGSFKRDPKSSLKFGGGVRKKYLASDEMMFINTCDDKDGNTKLSGNIVKSSLRKRNKSALKKNKMDLDDSNKTAAKIKKPKNNSRRNWKIPLEIDGNLSCIENVSNEKEENNRRNDKETNPSVKNVLDKKSKRQRKSKANYLSCFVDENSTKSNDSNINSITKKRLKKQKDSFSLKVNESATEVICEKENDHSKYDGLSILNKVYSISKDDNELEYNANLDSLNFGGDIPHGDILSLDCSLNASHWFDTTAKQETSENKLFTNNKVQLTKGKNLTINNTHVSSNISLNSTESKNTLEIKSDNVDFSKAFPDYNENTYVNADIFSTEENYLGLRNTENKSKLKVREPKEISQKERDAIVSSENNGKKNVHHSKLGKKSKKEMQNGNILRERQLIAKKERHGGKQTLSNNNKETVLANKKMYKIKTGKDGNLTLSPGSQNDSTFSEDDTLQLMVQKKRNEERKKGKKRKPHRSKPRDNYFKYITEKIHDENENNQNKSNEISVSENRKHAHQLKAGLLIKNDDDLFSISSCSESSESSELNESSGRGLICDLFDVQ